MNANRKRPNLYSQTSADRYELYEEAVQQPMVILGFIEELFEAYRGRDPLTLREDFCGTAQIASLWASSHDDRVSYGIDIDDEVIQWAHEHNVQPVTHAKDRIHLIVDDVMNVDQANNDVVLSLNFSHFIYKQRSQLLAYLKHARASLADDGLLILDAFGGPGSMDPGADSRSFSTFDYIWEQVSFNPLTNEIECHIHFRFPNGGMMRKAFVYDWRMWSLPELCELLEEAGFDGVAIYFESEDGFVSDTEEVNLTAWVAYIVASP